MKIPKRWFLTVIIILVGVAKESIRTANRSEQPIVTDKICGFIKFDKVRYFGNDYFIKGRMSTGYAILMDIAGNKANFSAMPKGYKTPKMVNLQRLEARSTWMITTVAVIPNII